ncbi:long-chain fatty acid--CoA ligase [Thiocapsa rosea]|uniref:long-chain fatty acid--CoA ligase n=1 Tax=Thiocapsa rosea TaxID=69360 RepID=UPI0011C38B99
MSETAAHLVDHANMSFTDAGPVPARGDIAQQVFRYSAFTPDLVRPGSRVLHADGSPKWRIAPLRWTRIGDAVNGKRDPRATMDALAAAQDQLLQRLVDNGQIKLCAPRLHPPQHPAYWLARPGAPKPRRDDGKPPGRTIAFAALLAAWRDGRSGG